MARCIDVDEYRKRLEMICGDGYTKQVIDIFIAWFMSIAESTESEDVAPVVHAHWIERRRNYMVCSNCGKYKGDWRTESFVYCPHCGAKMDEEQ